ncbi:MAG: hypothetical protein P4M11_11555 [Candidatus Pacebacteria bacterium]|nr:hypothetical protein [Candidatus Paceibacterota bacterium]
MSRKDSVNSGRIIECVLGMTTIIFWAYAYVALQTLGSLGVISQGLGFILVILGIATFGVGIMYILHDFENPRPEKYLHGRNHIGLLFMLGLLTLIAGSMVRDAYYMLAHLNTETGTTLLYSATFMIIALPGLYLGWELILFPAHLEAEESSRTTSANDVDSHRLM